MNIRLIGRGILPPLLGAVRYALTLALFCVVWWYDARYLNWAFDFNRQERRCVRDPRSFRRSATADLQSSEGADGTRRFHQLRPRGL